MAAANNKLAIQVNTVDALVAEFRKRWDFQEDDEKMIQDFKDSLVKSNDAKPKRTRAPSAYNLFVQSKKDELIAAGFKGKDLIREAAKLWKEQQQ